MKNVHIDPSDDDVKRLNSPHWWVRWAVRLSLALHTLVAILKVWHK